MKKMKGCNVILITLDGLRRDYLNKCPTLLKLTKESLFFNNMISCSPYSISAMHSLMSGLYPSKNGVSSYYKMFDFRKDKCKSLSRYMQSAGYYTIADVISDSIINGEEFDKCTFHKNECDFIDRHTRIIKETVSMKKKFFLYFQYNGLHRNMIENVRKKYGHFDDEYFGNIERNKKNFLNYALECDEYVKAIFNTIKNLGITENTIVIFHSDHGTSVGERKGEPMYSIYAYDYTLRIFSIFLIPGINPVEVGYQCNLIDIMPTIMDLVEIKENPEFERLQGKSLITFVEGKEKEDRVVFIETGSLGGPWPSPKKHNVFAIRYKNKKLIYYKTPDKWEFYDLKDDPNENNNLIENKKYEEYIKKYRELLFRELEENDIIL